MSKQIKLTITPKGIKWDSSGFEGEGCMVAYKAFVERMKAKGVTCDEKSREMKNEVYVGESNEETVSNGY